MFSDVHMAFRSSIIPEKCNVFPDWLKCLSPIFYLLEEKFNGTLIISFQILFEDSISLIELEGGLEPVT